MAEQARKPSPIVSRDREKPKEKEERAPKRSSSFAREQAAPPPPPARAAGIDDAFLAKMDSFVEDAPAPELIEMLEAESKELAADFFYDKMDEAQDERLDQVLLPMEMERSRADISQNVDDIKMIMQENIEKVLERGESLEALVSRSDELELDAQQFRRKAAEIKQKMEESQKLDDESETMLQMLDPDRTGYTTLETMYRAATSMGEKPNDGEFAEMVKRFGDSEGRIDLRKMVRIVSHMTLLEELDSNLLTPFLSIFSLKPTAPRSLTVTSRPLLSALVLCLSRSISLRTLRLARLTRSTRCLFVLQTVIFTNVR